MAIVIVIISFFSGS
uniref:Uncharacterized protein n=1 Tax=Rhizophora mucronata TaxID=61149 RepID=A0A2P2NWF6_RHIMU